jgi:hypothetical protein
MAHETANRHPKEQVNIVCKVRRAAQHTKGGMKIWQRGAIRWRL